MIIIEILKKEECPYKIILKGHAGYSNKGSDIICAGVSSIMNTLIVGVNDIFDLDIVTSKNENKGELIVEIPNNIEKSIKEKLNLLFNVAICGLKSVKNEYEKFIEIKES